MFEKQKADENEQAAKRMMEKPQGRRHDAFTDYHQRIQMGDEVHGYDAEAVSHSDFCTALKTSRSTATACCIWLCLESLQTTISKLRLQMNCMAMMQKLLQNATMVATIFNMQPPNDCACTNCFYASLHLAMQYHSSLNALLIGAAQALCALCCVDACLQVHE